MKPHSTLYRGLIINGVCQVLVNGKPLPPRLDLRNHSPTGFGWSYGGSGPSQLALAILADFLQDDLKALAIYQPFKWRIVAQLPQGEPWMLTGAQILGAVEVLEGEMRGRTT